jgi:hypothetical protein
VLTVPPLLRYLQRQRFREAMHAGLRRGIVGLTEPALGADDRRHVDDAAPATLYHAVAHWLRHVEHRIEVGPDDRVLIDLVELFEAASRVVPALLIRMSTGPTSALIRAMHFSHES